MAITSGDYKTWTDADWAEARTVLDANKNTPEGQMAIYGRAQDFGMSAADLSSVLGRLGNPVSTSEIDAWADANKMPYLKQPTPAMQTFTPQTATATGYPATGATATTYDPTGYTSRSYDPTMASTQGYTSQGYTAGGYSPSLISGQESVSDAMTRIIGSGSPYMQQAETTALHGMGRRGLVNSTMAVGAAQDAAIRQALPIAQGDVATSLSVNLANQGAQNRSSEFLASAMNSAAQFAAEATNRASEFTAAAANQGNLFNAAQANAASAFAAQAYNQAAQFNAAATNTAAMFGAGAQNTAAMFTAQQMNNAAQFAAAAQNAASMFNASAYNSAMQNYSNSVNTAVIAQSNQDAAFRLAELQNTHSLLISSSSSAANTLANGLAQIINVLKDPTVDKTTAIQHITDFIESAFTALDAAIGSPVFRPVLNFGPTT